MKIMKSYLLLSLFLAGYLTSLAQTPILSVGSGSALTIKSGMAFGLDSLGLTPVGDLTLSSNSVKVILAAVNMAPAPSINRVYYFGSQILFTGTIQVSYQPSDLNSSNEATLEYTDSSTMYSWLADPTSSVNTSLHYVQTTVTAHPFIGSTASGQAAILPLNLLSFTGNWTGNTPALLWIDDQIDETVTFDIQSCANGVSWQQIGEVNGQPGNGQDTYQFTDNHPTSNTIYYRLKLLQASGHFSYSNIVLLQKSDNGSSIRIGVSGNSVSVYFTGAKPTGIRLIGALGQILQSDRTSRQQYDMNGLFPGTYFLQFDLNGQWNAREFVIR